MVLNTITRFSYCMETIIQAGNKQLKIASIPIATNPKTRESRLFKSTPEHVLQVRPRDRPLVPDVQALRRLPLADGGLRGRWV